tara:strand:+ start:1780 stop:2793 length:1014 start_codon:yes stop_codon:yes gene_type:complete
MEFSVVIPSRDRPKQVVSCLESIIRMFSLTALSYELIIVDDGSQSNLKQGYLDLVSVHNVNLLNSGGRGPSAARNLGALKSLGKWIYFIDDDVVMDEDSLLWWSERHLPSAAGYQGVTKVNGSPDWSEVQASKTDFIDGFGSGNIIYRRDLFLQLGGFDEAYFLTTFGIHFREDTDLGLRFLRNGHELPVVDQMSAKHPPKEQKDPWFLLNDARKYFLEPYFKIRNPEASLWIGSAFTKGRLGTYQLRGAISLLFVSLIPFLKPLWPVVPIILLGLYILLSGLIFRGIKLRNNFWRYAPALLILYPLVHGFSYLAGFIFGPRKPKLIEKVVTEFKGE